MIPFETYIDLSNLPEFAQREVFDFWEFIKIKYSKLPNHEIIENNESYAQKFDKLNLLASQIYEYSISDPSEWQKDIRFDKKLFGRD